MRWRMHKRTEQKEDGRRIYYYTFTPAEPSERLDRLDMPDRQGETEASRAKGGDGC